MLPNEFIQYIEVHIFSSNPAFFVSLQKTLSSQQQNGFASEATFETRVSSTTQRNA